MIGRLNYLCSPQLERPVLVVGWREDSGSLGEQVIKYLNQELSLESLAEIDPVGYFSLSGVQVSADVVGFPESRFYYSEKSSLISFISDIPVYEINEFLKLVLEVATRYNVSRIILVNGFPVMASHNTPSMVLANVNSSLVKEWISGDGINTDVNFESPPGQKPPVSTYLIWKAGQQDIPAVSLWLPVPFYLAATVDSIGVRRLLAFLKEKLTLPLDMDAAVANENQLRELLANLRSDSHDVEKYLSMMERNLSLTEYEAGQLVAAVRQATS
ncbi:hypothetical protein DGWBC_0764 [Dehalogenimonas sp. WBC-2]|nr:hypothetical protein DGWBC_0764 [Dehalogenimonas sp. WBC-2]